MKEQAPPWLCVGAPSVCVALVPAGGRPALLDPATREGRRPRRPDARGAQGQRGRCPSNFGIVIEFTWRAVGLGGLMRAGHKGSEAAAPPFFCGGPPAPAA